MAILRVFSAVTIGTTMSDSRKQINLISDRIDDSLYHSEMAKGILKDAVEDTKKVPSLVGVPENTLEQRVDNWLKYIDKWLIDEVSYDSAVFAVKCHGSWNINKSEKKGLAWCSDTFDLVSRSIERRQSPDFVVSRRVGVEVKSNKKYTLQKAQVHAADNLDRLHIVVANKNGVWLEDTIDWIGLNEIGKLS